MKYEYTEIRPFDRYLYRVVTELPINKNQKCRSRKIDTSDPMPMCDARTCRDTMERLAADAWKNLQEQSHNTVQES